MASILQTIYLSAFVEQNVRIAIKILLNYVPKDPADRKPAMIHMMSWRLLNAKPLSEPMIL